MSDGMNDTRALGRQGQAVHTAAYHLAQALKNAHDGHRGWAISNLALEEIVNGYLTDAELPFALRVRNL